MTPRRPRPQAPTDSAARDEVRALYAEVDAAYAGTSCPGTTECCRFGRTGREPYVTPLELALLVPAMKHRPGSARRRPLPLHQVNPELPPAVDERACPLLDEQARCRVYAARPLGCRTYFCHRAQGDGAVTHRHVLEFVRKLREISARHGLSAEGRPLSRALAALR